MKTLMYLCSILICVTVIAISCSPKKKLKNVTSVLHLDSAFRAENPVPPDTSTLKTMDSPVQEAPHLFRSRTKNVLETKGYQMMSCCDCTRGGGCCTCPPEAESSEALYQFAAPAEYKKAYLIPAISGKSNINMKSEESDDLTIFSLEQQPENGDYTFELQGRRVMSIRVTVEDGTLRVAKTTNR